MLPRAPDERIEKAEKLYKSGKKLVDISKELGVPEGTVRRWKHDKDWDGKLKKKQSERSEKTAGEKANVRKRGAPKGNTNAKGHTNPVPPPDRTKHGGYSAVYWDVLDEEEKGLIEDIPKDEEELLIEQIQLFSVRERRIMQAINKYRAMDAADAVSMTSRTESKRAFKTEADEEEYYRIVAEKVDKGARMPGQEYTSYTQTENKDNIIARLESELSNVQSKKTKAIEALSRIHLEKAKIEGDSKGNDIVKSWADKVLKARRELSNE